MVEKSLEDALKNYNRSLPNSKYRQNWGSLLNFIGKLNQF